MITNKQRSDLTLNKKDKICRKIIEYGILGVIVFSPLPAASVYGWSILAIELAVLVMTAAYILMGEKPQNNELLSESLKWPKYLFCGLFIFIFFQLIPFPSFLVKIFSPSIHSFRSLFSSGFSSPKFMSFSLIPSHTLREGLELLSYFLLGFLIVKTVTRKQQIMRIFYVLVGMGIFEALYGMFELYNRNPSILFYKKIYNLDSVTGTFVNRNHFSGYLEMIIPLAIGIITARIDLFSLGRLKRREKVARLSERRLGVNVILFAGVIVMAVAIILSKSRAGVFLLVFIFILFFELQVLYSGRARDHQRLIRNFLKVSFLVIIVFSIYIGVGTTIERFSLDKLKVDEGRPVYWGKVTTIIGDYPLFGTGLGTFASVYPAYDEDLRDLRLSHAHNDYLEYLAELGIIGMILLFGGVAFVVVSSFLIWRVRRHPEVKGLAAGGIVAIVAILTHSITDFNLHIPANMVLFSVVVSLTMATAFYKRDKVLNKNKLKETRKWDGQEETKS
jgi:O-antigen ligase